MDIFSYELGKKAGTTPINLQNKDITITENTTTSVTADVGYTGLGTVAITTNVPTGLDWTELGYSGEPDFIQKGYDYALDVLDNWDASVTTTYRMFRESRQLYFCPDVDMSNVTTMEQMFNNSSALMYAKLTNIPNVTNINSTFATCRALTKLILGSATISQFSNALENCLNLKEVDLSGIEITNNCSLVYLFYGSISLNIIDISKMDFTNFSGTSSQMFKMCGIVAKQVDGAYADGLPYVYVKDLTAQTWVINQATTDGLSWSTANVVIKS